MSTFVAYQPDPRKNFVGISSVVVLHVVVVYALATGLARKVVEAVQAPIETKLIEEVKEIPPPPKNLPPPPPIANTPPPPFVPPPEVLIANAPPAATIAVVANTPPPVQEVAPPTVAAPPAPPPPAPAPAKPVKVDLNEACAQQPPPRLTSKQEGVAGYVKARLTIRGGKVTNVDILESKPKGFFDNSVRNALLSYGCQSPGDQTLVGDQAFNFAAE